MAIIRSTLCVILCGLATATLGCGGKPPSQSDQELIEMQRKDQQQADESERQMIKESKESRSKKK